MDDDRGAPGLTASERQILRQRLTLDWLIGYLHPRQRQALALLSLFAGSFGADGLAALLGGAPDAPSTHNEPARQLWTAHDRAAA